MKQIVTATAAFERMREKDVVYVDKTAYFYQLLQRDPDTVFFIARPRRFGKSLMINTLTTLLQGKRDYFRGLAIDGTDYDWGKHKVIRLRMTDACAATPEGVRAAFAMIPYEWICKDEAEAKRYFLLFCKFMKADISGERQSARGRADAVLRTPQAVYVFEFKHGRSAAEAVAQARTKDYGGPDAAGDRPVYLVGVNYNPETRTIDEPLVEPL